MPPLSSECWANSPATTAIRPATGDTGGIIYSLISQLQNRTRGQLELVETVAWGAVAGGFTRSYIGGTYFEKNRGEKMSKLTKFYLFLLKLDHSLRNYIKTLIIN